MTQQIKCIDLNEAAGKIVKAITHGESDGDLLIVFTDGSLIQFYADSEDSDADISGCSRFEPCDFRWEVLQEAIGDLYPEIVATRKKETENRLAHDLGQVERREQAEYERLRKKFYGGEA